MAKSDLGIEYVKPVKKNLTVRLDPDFREMLEVIAKAELRTLANQITLFLNQGIADYMKEHKIMFERTDASRKLEIKPDPRYSHDTGTAGNE